LSIDQIVLSPQTYRDHSPGQLKNDRTILSGNGGVPLPENKPPTVSIAAAPQSGDASLLVTFTPDAADADGSIVSYHWDFGDGEKSTETSPQHLYRLPGKFNVRLVVTDDRGATAGASTSIQVKDRAGVRTLRVMTWNIHKGVGTDDKSSLNKIAAWIDTLNADLVSLCEVMRRSDGDDDDEEDDQLQYLAESLKQKTGVRWYYHWFAKHPGDNEGNGILSRLPFIANDGKYLSYQRSVARVTVRVGANEVNFFATHLDHDTPSQRLTQAIELTNWMSGFHGVNIIGGDFNASAKSAEIGRILDFYRDSWQEAKANGVAKSYPDNPSGRTRRSRIDYLFYGRNSPNLLLKGAQLPDTRDLSKKNVKLKLGTPDDKGVRPSDHNAVVVDYEIK
jgi:endonuclease/exonuclease/phosphatase family metal-dependent hydrolase